MKLICLAQGQRCVVGGTNILLAGSFTYSLKHFFESEGSDEDSQKSMKQIICKCFPRLTIW